MKNREDIEKLEKIIGQLGSAYAEIAALSKKSPNDAVNKFKIKLVNKILSSANDYLGERYRPIDDFLYFDEDDMPTTSDIAVVLSQYMEEAERYRSDNVADDYGWVYVINGKASTIAAAPPSRIKKR